MGVAGALREIMRYAGSITLPQANKSVGLCNAILEAPVNIMLGNMRLIAAESRVLESTLQVHLGHGMIALLE
jgi:hypothetical protein